MRFLIVSAFFACAAAAPQIIVGPAVTIPAAVPTISSGDIEAAAINAQVQANDLARSVADKVQDNVDIAVAINDASVGAIDQINEQNQEAFWSNEDKKWQAVDAVKSAEAAIDGAVASNADAYAKSAIVAPVASVAPIAPISPIQPVVLANSVINPYTGVYPYSYNVLPAGPIVSQPILRYSPFAVPGAYGPNIIQNVW